MRNSNALLLLFSMFHFFAVSQNVSKDQQIGEEGLEMVKQQMGLYQNMELQSYISELGQKLVAQLENPLFDYEFYLIDSPEPNAFALPGGKIFVTRGLLALPITEDELAGVLGHEIIHSNNRHGVKTSAGSVFGGIIAIPGVIIGGILGGPVGTALASPFLASNQLLKANYSRSNEKESDKFGTQLAAKAGYEPIQLANILERLSLEAELLTGEAEEKNYFASHPYTPKRVSAINKHSQKYLPVSPTPLKSNKEFIQLFDGLMIGQNPQYGYVENGHFYHPEHLFRFSLPSNWQTAITPVSFSLGSDEGDAVLSFIVETDSSGHSGYLNSFEKAMYKQNRMTPNNKGDFSWYKNKGAMLEYQSESSGELLVFQIYAVDYGKNKVFKIAAMFKSDKRSQVESLLKNASVIKKKDLPKTKVPTIFIKTSSKEKSLAEIIENTNSKDYAQLIMLLNEHSLEYKIKAGTPVKIIEDKEFSFN